MKFFGVPIQSFNMEITNRCSIACPECPRTNNPWVTKDLTDLPVSVLEKVFPLARRDEFEGLWLNLCGAYGDCIYHPRFHDVIAYLKQAGLRVCIETNGSHRKLSWWERTCELLGEGDSITFSVDGLEDTNHLYRVNSRWSSILPAMKYCAPRLHVGWKFIVFRHNEHQIDAAKALAADIGVRDIVFKKSGRFVENDALAPENEEFIGVVTRNRRRVQALIDAKVDAQQFDREVSIRPKCRFGKNIAITARGYLYPCTSCETSDESTWFFQNRDHFCLHTRSVEDILHSSRWAQLESTWMRASSAPKACLYYCSTHRSFDESYTADSRSDRPNKPEDALKVEFNEAERPSVTS